MLKFWKDVSWNLVTMTA